MKKALLIVLTCVFAAILLCACNSDTESAGTLAVTTVSENTGADVTTEASAVTTPAIAVTTEAPSDLDVVTDTVGTGYGEIHN